MNNKFIAVTNRVQENDIIASDLGVKYDVGDVVFDAMETEGEIYVVADTMAAAQHAVEVIEFDFDLELTQIIQHIVDGVHTLERYKDQGFADDVFAYIEKESKGGVDMRKGVVNGVVKNNEEEQVKMMMESAGFTVGMEIATKLGTMTIRGFEATADGVLVRVQAEGKPPVKVHASQLKAMIAADVEEAKTSVKVAFEGQSQVPTSVSAEDEAMARIQNSAKQTIKNEMKNEEEVKMTKTMTTAQQVANLSAAQQFMASVEGKMVGAQKPAKKEEVKATETQTNKEEMVKVVGTVQMGGRNNAGRKESGNLNKNTAVKEENGAMVKKEAAVGRNNAGTNAGRQSTGMKVNFGAVSAAPANARLTWDDSVRGTMTKKETASMPWYLNAANYPALNDMASVLVTRKHEELGITGINLLNPKSELAYENHNILAIVEVVFGKGINLRFRVEQNQWKSEKSVADLRSSNVVWEEKWNAESFRKELTPAYAFARKNNVDLQVECCGVKHDAAIGDVVKCEKCGAEHNVNMTASYTVKKQNGQLEERASKVNYFGWTKTTLGNFNIDVDKNVVAIAMAFAQFALGFEMYGLLTVEEEDMVLDALEGKN